jgi:hypothetical protein
LFIADTKNSIIYPLRQIKIIERKNKMIWKEKYKIGVNLLPGFADRRHSVSDKRIIRADIGKTYNEVIA